MKNIHSPVRLAITVLLSLFLALVPTVPAGSQSAITSVVITSVNANKDFPQVRVQVKALDANNAFVPGLDINQFSIREDGESLPIESLTSEALPLDLRVVFIIDELSIGARVPQIRQSIESFAQDQMQAGDSVIVLSAANKGETRVVVPLTNDPQAVQDGIQESNYNPSSASSTALLDAVNQALRNLSDLNENIQGLSKIVVFSVSVQDQIDLDETIVKAQALGIPIHTILLGSQDANGALGNLARGTQAGAGAILLDDIDDLNTVLDPQRDENQYLLSYRSRADQPGEHTLVVDVSGLNSKTVTFAVDQLEASLVNITSPASDSKITRTETLFNQDSDSVLPTEQTIAVEINFPDGHPRQIVQEKTVLVVNGRSLGAATAIRDNGKDLVLLEFTWDLRAENIAGINPVSIVIEAEDELGLKSRSVPLNVTVEYISYGADGETEVCPSLISSFSPLLCSNWDLLLPLTSLLIALLALALVVVYLRRNPKVQERVKERLLTMVPGGAGRSATRIVLPSESAKAVLMVLEGNSGSKQTEFSINTTTTIGRSAEHAQLVLQGDRDGSSISRLHCTIIEKEDGFELRDESSANGTHLNDVRLVAGKLHRLRDGDTIELARVRDGGLKLKFQLAQRPAEFKTRIISAPAKEDVDKIPQDGYTPTKKL